MQMNELADFNRDGFSRDEFAAIEDDLREQLRIYFRHLVGIAGAYEHIDANRSVQDTLKGLAGSCCNV